MMRYRHIHRRPKRRVRPGRSKIHGRGAFATHVLLKGEVFTINHLGRRKWGGFNHSCRPNVILCWTQDGDQFCVALRRIERREELTVSYSIKHGRLRSGERCNCPHHKRKSK
jgi:hypothetical protein